jgi:hypothetical protein
MNRLSVLSARPDASARVGGAALGAGMRPSSSSLATLVSDLSVPERTTRECADSARGVGGYVERMSRATVIRPEPTSHSTSHESKLSKIGFVTPAM